jgi:16S rRNA (guanine1516-N2)-methyltransferase
VVVGGARDVDGAPAAATIPGVTPHENPPQPEHDDLVLVRGDRGLEIEDRAQPRATAFRVDFLGGPTARRGVGISRKTHPLARAVGRHRPLRTILDGTAGLGRDAFVLACLGYRVTAVERSPVLFALLSDGVARLLAHPKGTALVGDRLRIEPGDCVERWRAGPRPEVVYLDPMFPHRQKSALVKKEMQLLQKLLGTTPADADEVESRELAAAARAVATHRVVVKRPRRTAPLLPGVSYTVPGPRVRFDVYLAGAAPLADETSRDC